MQVCLCIGKNKLWKFKLAFFFFLNFFKKMYSFIGKNSKKSCKWGYWFLVIVKKFQCFVVIFVRIYIVTVDSNYNLVFIFSQIRFFKFLSYNGIVVYCIFCQHNILLIFYLVKKKALRNRGPVNKEKASYLHTDAFTCIYYNEQTIWNPKLPVKYY